VKRKEFLTGILLLFIFISGMTSNVSAVNYGIGVNQNEGLVWKCNVCNNAEMDKIFGSGWDSSGIFTNLSKGANMKWKINSTEINSNIINIEYDIWYWNLSDDWGIKDNSSQINIFVDPTAYSTNYMFLNYTSLVPFLLPIPIGEYLGGLSVNLSYWYDVDNRVLPTLNVYVPKDDFYLGNNKGIDIIAIYNDRGILNSYKLYGKDNTVIIDIALDFLPSYVIPTLIGLVVVFSIGIAFYIIKKKFTRDSSLNKK
jgi:hypothetical protein